MNDCKRRLVHNMLKNDRLVCVHLPACEIRPVLHLSGQPAVLR